MKTTDLFKPIAVLFVAVLLATGCDNSKDNSGIEPIVPDLKAMEIIAGKWLLIAEALSIDSKEGVYEICRDPDGTELFRYPQVKMIERNEEYYTEFLSNGKIRYGTGNGQSQDCDCTYQMDTAYLYVYYDKKIYSSDSDTVDKYIFSDDYNELKLVYVDGLREAKYPFYPVKIYKRIN